MGLKEGTLGTLIESGNYPPVAEDVFHQILQALDCLAVNDIVHRDVKPENILWVRSGNQYQFQLGDFGLSNRAAIAATSVGSPLFMAPEMFQKAEQTHKVDVWSLFVTMLWTLDVGEFRQKSNKFRSPGEARESVLVASSNEKDISNIREMAIVSPERRASAAQMLVKCFDGVGLITPRNQVPALDFSSIIVTKDPARAAHKRPSRKKAATAAQNRVEKACIRPQVQPPIEKFLSQKKAAELG